MAKSDGKVGASYAVGLVRGVYGEWAGGVFMEIGAADTAPGNVDCYLFGSGQSGSKVSRPTLDEAGRQVGRDGHVMPRARRKARQKEYQIPVPEFVHIPRLVQEEVGQVSSRS